MLIKCPVIYLGLSKTVSLSQFHSFSADLRVLLQVCEGRDESRAVSDSNLEACSSGSGVMRREVVSEPVVLSIHRHCHRKESAYHAITEGELGKTPRP